jgi:hypothetical protein
MRGVLSATEQIVERLLLVVLLCVTFAGAGSDGRQSFARRQRASRAPGYAGIQLGHDGSALDSAPAADGAALSRAEQPESARAGQENPAPALAHSNFRFPNIEQAASPAPAGVLLSPTRAMCGAPGLRAPPPGF